MDNPSTLNDSGRNPGRDPEKDKYGHNVAIVMALKKNESKPNAGQALPLDASNIRERLQVLSQKITSNHADLLELLVRFDDEEGWKCNGSKHCAAWMNAEIGISIQIGWEYLRVGRKLRTLTTLRALFRVGKVSWSKVRLISRVADETNERILCHAALDASVSDIKTLCEGYRWNEDDSDVDTENEKAMQQWLSRSLTWKEASNGNTKIQITLPPEMAQAFLNSVEQSLNQLDTESDGVSQRRADAAVLMAEKSLQSEEREIATADRYQVVVSVDADELKNTEVPVDNHSRSHIPKKRSTVQNTGPIAKETARRIACDCSISVNHTSNGQPINIGRKSRVWPSAMARAIKDRDQICVWPGCIQSRHLHIHHIKHWADGGETSVNNGACLCSHHHTLVHEGGYTIENVEVNEDQQLLDMQFFQQLHITDTNQFDFEKDLRSDWESFNSVRQLMPSTYRFRILNADGLDITENGLDILNDYIRVECREPVGEYCAGIHRRHPAGMCVSIKSEESSLSTVSYVT